jgi:hypothetical protein
MHSTASGGNAVVFTLPWVLECAMKVPKLITTTMGKLAHGKHTGQVASCVYMYSYCAYHTMVMVLEFEFEFPGKAQCTTTEGT